MKILKHHLKAQLIYKRIQQLKKDAFARLQKQGFFDELAKAHQDLFLKEKLDYKTAFLLKKILERHAGETPDDPIKQTGIDMLLEELQILKELEDGDSKTIILSSDGDLYREPKIKYCYHMRNAKKPLAILRMLKTTYIPTNIIRDEIEIASDPATRKLIGKIRSQAKIHLGLKNKPLFIESKGEGYRISPYYKLIKK